MPPGPRGEVGPAVVCLIENRQVVFSVAVVFDCLHGGLEATKAPPAYGVYVEISLSDCIIKSQKNILLLPQSAVLSFTFRAILSFSFVAETHRR